MGPRGQPHLLSDRRVPGRRPMMSSVQPDDLSQHMRIAWVGLRAGGAVPFPITGHLQRVDRVDGVAGRDQRLHPRTAVSLDPHQHLVGLIGLTQMLRDQPVQHSDAGHPLRQPATGQQLGLPIFDLNVVVGLSPIVADEQHLSPPESANLA
jgi:hypothetical protein